MTLTDELRAANVRDFHRPALASVFAEYEAFMATGQYPYADAVVCFVADRHGIPLLGTHHERYVKEPIGNALSHEVSLASGQWKVREMVAREAEYVAQGYDRPITDLVPSEGLRVVLANNCDLVLRCKWFNRSEYHVPGGGEWGLCPPRKRNGISLSRLTDQHRAYEVAKQENQTRMNGPRVVMYRLA